MKKYRLNLSFPSVLEFVPSVRTLVSETLQHFDYDEKETFRTELIVDELCNNAIVYGSSKASDHVVLNIEFDDNGFEIKVEDKGKNRVHKDRLKHFYEKLTNSVNDKLETKGLALVKLLADNVTIKALYNGETQIHAVKFREKEGDGNEL